MIGHFERWAVPGAWREGSAGVCVRLRGRAAAAAARGAGRGAGFSSVLFYSILFKYAAPFVSVEVI